MDSWVVVKEEIRRQLWVMFWKRNSKHSDERGSGYMTMDVPRITYCFLSWEKGGWRHPVERWERLHRGRVFWWRVGGSQELCFRDAMLDMLEDIPLYSSSQWVWSSEEEFLDQSCPYWRYLCETCVSPDCRVFFLCKDFSFLTLNLPQYFT